MEKELLMVLKYIHVDQSLGTDQVYQELCGKPMEAILGALAKIFVSTLTTAEVANVVSIFQKGNKDKSGTCRPVSLINGGQVPGGNSVRHDLPIFGKEN